MAVGSGSVAARVQALQTIPACQVRRYLDGKYALEYALRMERITASFDRKTVQEIRKLAGRRGVSAFLEVAARERLAKLKELALLDELDAKYGAPSAAVRREVEAEARRIFRR